MPNLPQSGIIIGMANWIIEHLRGDHANNQSSNQPSLNQVNEERFHTAMANRLDRQTPEERQQHREERDQTREQAKVEEHFQDQESFLRHDVEPLHFTDWHYTVPDEFPNWDSRQQLGYLRNVLVATNNRDANPENLFMERKVFEQAINAMAGDVPYEIIHQLKVAFDHPEKIANINVDKIMEVKGNYNHWMRGDGLNRKSEKSREELQEYEPNVVDCGMDRVKSLDRDGRAALRAAIDGDFRTAEKFLMSKRCMEWTDDLVEAIKGGATVTEQTIESLNRMSKTDGAGKITGTSSKASTFGSPSSASKAVIDIDTDDDDQPPQHYTSWRRVR